MNRLARAALVAASCCCTGCGAPGSERERSAEAAASVTGIRFLAAGESGEFRRADAPRDLSFPEDHGSHPAFRTEWWYFTGNLFGADERHFGFELTFFRVALSAAPAARQSGWAANQVWMAHFAVTDTAARQFLAAERLTRGALGLAGATAAPFRVWVEDWSARGDITGRGDVRLSAATPEAGIDLALEGFDRIVLQGERGHDRKGPEPGNASYYYSAPRLAARGTVRIGGGAAQPVAGLAWMDREWGTSALSPGIEGWDWFALQLDDGRDLMFYRLRGADGGTSPFSGGTITSASGASRRLAAEDVELEVLDHWESEATGVTYPVAWRMRIPGEGLELELTPRLRDQEVRLSVRYWEGAVAVAGRGAGGSVGGHGYLELAGY